MVHIQVCFFIVASALFFFTPCCSEESAPFVTLNDAVLRTLRNQKEIQISILNVSDQAGVLQQSAAPFDPTLASSVVEVNGNAVQKNPLGTPQPDPSHFKLNDTITTATLSKQTRIGTSFLLSGQYEYYSSLPFTSRNTQVFFQVTQPLLRHFLHGINRQREEGNFLELQAVNWDTLQTISSRILTTINHYWEAVASGQSVTVLEKAVKRIENLVELTQKLIQGELLAAEDINQMIAVLTTQKRLLLQAQAMLFAAKQQLLFAMGEQDEASDYSFDEKSSWHASFRK